MFQHVTVLVSFIFALALIYWNGDGVPRDQAKAAELWKAAYQGGRMDAAPLLAKWLFAS